MVAYGSSLRKTRRAGWEDAYLDYDALKLLLEVMEDTQGDANRRRVSILFTTALRKSIEKVSLFALTRQGEIADAIGALRFKGDLGSFIASPPLAKYRKDVERKGEDTALAATRSMSKRSISVIEKEVALDKQPLFRGRTAEFELKTDEFSGLGVELLYLLQFICVNAMAIRKILKKYQKLSSTTPSYDDENPEPSKISPDDHLQQLANSASVAAIQSSLLSALGEIEAEQPKLHFPPSLIRFQCVMRSIETLREYAQIVNQPFGVFLSRRAMIVNGGELGGLEGKMRLALELVLRFRPEEILYMDDADLEEWRSEQLKPRPRAASYYGGTTLIGLEEVADGWGGVNSMSMMINLLSTLLYTVRRHANRNPRTHY
jgi:hypothetical protein